MIAVRPMTAAERRAELDALDHKDVWDKADYARARDLATGTATTRDRQIPDGEIERLVDIQRRAIAGERPGGRIRR